MWGAVESGDVTLFNRRIQGQDTIQVVLLPPRATLALDEPEGVDLIVRAVQRALAAGWSLAPVMAALGPHLRH